MILQQTNIVVITFALVCIYLSVAREISRSKTMSFSFPKPGDDFKVDESVTVPMLPPPPLPSSIRNLLGHGAFAKHVNVATDQPLNAASPQLRNVASDQPGNTASDELDNVTLEEPDISASNSNQSPKRSATTTVDHRDDCPFDKNFCIYLNPCTSDQHCYMNLRCTNYRCVDKKKPTTSPADVVVGNIDDSYRDDCPTEENLCLDPARCMANQLCFMNQECTNSMCVDKKSTGSTSQPSTQTTGRSKQCPSSDMLKCVHGYCEEEKRSNGDMTMRCVCDKGWTDDRCNMPCTLNCVHGTCKVRTPPGEYFPPENVTDEIMMCNCKYGWQGRFCQEKTPDLVEEAEREKMELGAGLGTAMILTIVISLVVLVILWRKRVIVVMKLLYFFKVEEINDGRSYDAYVSMGTSRKGIDFVKNKLCPTLSDFGFKVYVQERDLMAGEVLSESIPKAMEQSRRTILIITPEYLHNEWSQFECLIAQIETLRLHQRIIPIVLEDISGEKQNISKTMKHILESVKCLKFPSAKSSESVSLKEWRRKEDRFWKRLQLTMPKKKKCNDKEPETEISQDEISNVDERPIDIKSIGVMYHVM